MIVPMKKATLYALKQDRDALLVALQRSGELMVVATEESIPQSGYQEAEAALKKAQDTLGFLDRSVGKKPVAEKLEPVPTKAMFEDDPEAVRIVAEIAGLEERSLELTSTMSALTSRIDQLAPWLPLDTAAENLKSTRLVTVMTGYAPSAALEKIADAADETGSAVQVLADGPDGTAVVVYAHKDNAAEVSDAVKSLGFTESVMPKIKGTPAQQKAELTAQLESARAEQEELRAKVEELSPRRAELELFYDKCATESNRLSTRNTETDATFCLTGWVPKDKVDEVKKAVADTTDAYDLTITDPPEGEKPPTLSKNSKLVRQFETITDMFSRPDPNEADPNPMMAPWYWIIFGMMMADFGYGVIMAVLFAGFLKIRKPKGEFGKLVRVLLYCSVSTAIWGVLFGSYFGEEFLPGLLKVNLLKDPITVLLICAGLGALHIFCGFILNMINKIRSGDAIGGILDNIPWIVLLSGLALMFVPAFGNIGTIMALAGALVILLTAGRHKKGIIGKIIGGLGGLYGIINHLSDILSYSRILALALSSAVVAMVMNILAGMLQGNFIGFIFSIVVYIIGHAFNLVMGLLSAYVHASRLQYIEFFGKFYEGNGYAFAPLSIKNKYTPVQH